MSSIPTLSSARLRLVPLSADCDALYDQFYTDSKASAAYGGPLTPGAAWTRLASDLGNWHLQGFGVWAIQRKADGALIGTCGFWQGKGWPRELTWWLLPAARGNGFAVEASRSAIEHALASWGWESVETYLDDTNEAAKALVLRLGGEVLERRVFPDGLERNLYRLPRAITFLADLTQTHALVYRRATPDDASECIALRGRTRQNAISPESLQALGITRETWADGTRSGELIGWVCVTDGQLVGYCFGARSTGEIVVLALTPAAEGRGIGKHLLKAVMDDLTSIGHTRLFLACSPDPESRSHGFYRHLGWYSTGQLEAHGDEILAWHEPQTQLETPAVLLPAASVPGAGFCGLSAASGAAAGT